MADLLNTNPNDNYGDDAIVTLSPREHIRLRPGMYIGKLGDGAQADDGIYVLIKEVVDNSVDEFIMGVGRQIDISIEDKVVSVRDYGRGIPLKSLAAAVSEMNTGGKYGGSAFKKTVGLNGVGVKAVNMLSSEFTARSVRDGNKKHVIILTRNASFVRKPTSHMHLIRQVYRQYPNFIATEEKRHLIDRRQRSSCALLSKTGQAFVLQPKQPLTISAMRADEQSLRELYIQGYEEAKEAFPQLMEFLSSPAQ